MLVVLTMTLAQRPDGKDVAQCGDFEAVSRNGVTNKLARMLVASGYPDQSWEARGQDGRLRFSGPSVHEWAKWTYEEGDGGLRKRRFVQNTRFPAERGAPGGLSEPAGICDRPDQKSRQRAS